MSKLGILMSKISPDNRNSELPKWSFSCNLTCRRQEREIGILPVPICLVSSASDISRFYRKMEG